MQNVTVETGPCNSPVCWCTNCGDKIPQGDTVHYTVAGRDIGPACCSEDCARNYGH